MTESASWSSRSKVCKAGIDRRIGVKTREAAQKAQGTAMSRYARQAGCAYASIVDRSSNVDESSQGKEASGDYHRYVDDKSGGPLLQRQSQQSRLEQSKQKVCRSD